VPSRQPHRPSTIPVLDVINAAAHEDSSCSSTSHIDSHSNTAKKEISCRFPRADLVKYSPPPTPRRSSPQSVAPSLHNRLVSTTKVQPQRRCIETVPIAVLGVPLRHIRKAVGHPIPTEKSYPVYYHYPRLLVIRLMIQHKRTKLKESISPNLRQRDHSLCPSFHTAWREIPLHRKSAALNSSKFNRTSHRHYSARIRLASRVRSRSATGQLGETLLSKHLQALSESSSSHS